MKILHLFLLALVLVGCSKPQTEERQVKFYQSPMHPWITSDKPGNCTICGMKLVPVYEGQEGLAARKDLISLSPDSVNVLNVATVPVRRMDLTKRLRFSGILEDDDTSHRIVAAFYDGRIDQVYVQHVGQYAEKGQPLAAIYSPELLYIVREYQNALRGKNDALARNSAQRLVQYGLSPDQITALAKQPESVYTIDLLAPISGTIVTKTAYQGQYIKTGEPLFEMGDLATLWFHAEVYERDLPYIRLGQKAVLKSPSVPSRDFEGTVTFIDPNFDPQTRSTKVRIEVKNPLAEGDGHGMRRVLAHRSYAEADLETDLGAALVVPRSAVLRDGRRTVVYVQNAEGQYQQQAVRTGRIGDEGIEILDGLKDGQRVVTQGNLMIDAEAQLRHGDVHGEMAETLPPSGPAAPEAVAFLDQLAKVSDALAGEDFVAAVRQGQSLHQLAEAVPMPEDQTVMGLVDALKKLSPPAGSDLKAVRQTFLPWSTTGSDLALALRRQGKDLDVRVFECPMTGDSFPNAPPHARWVQTGGDTRNPYMGSEMLNCGGEVKP